ncbi:hypothetical protein SAMD00019534_060100 [Acytostelium subglobosum LB1]|uniref:hypothetical protein n=1 Tax=Acytostelium subglobosum LB1 TaxID=1410327 RepID=UPI000644DEDA|nr:hypothetical protein SAMD00019534_060100 [Acytostelium subglobosum LB1]GAM22835.1 hypothetical protein SAMD00019534_060100 [Acytostelium subglobosum LB1]|eukprot:XP_012754062.1 hypothetical protein SAMD00019534_060100 [Acytostelium subglobosum LB1]
MDRIIDLLTTYLEQPFDVNDAPDSDVVDASQPSSSASSSTTTTTHINGTDDTTTTTTTNTAPDHHHTVPKPISLSSSSLDLSTNPAYDIFFQPLKTLTLDQVSKLASDLMQNEPISQLIIKKICSPGFSQSRNELLCQWFYCWFNLESMHTKRFVLSFVPALVWVFLQGPSPLAHIGIEAVLIGIYNNELVKREGLEKVFLPPNITLPSFIYKSVVVDNESGLTESTLKQLNSHASGVVTERPLTKIEEITTSNRTLLLRTVISVYTGQLVSMPHLSRTIFSEMCIRVSATGYPFLPLAQDTPLSDDDSDSNMRISTSNGIDLPKASEVTSSSSTLRASGSQASSSSTNLIERQRQEYDRKHFRMTSYLELSHHRHSDHHHHHSHRHHNGTNGHNVNNSNINNNNVIDTLINNHSHSSKGIVKRLFISESVYRELVTGLTFCAFQEATKAMSTMAIKSINERANHDLVPEVMLYTNALLQQLRQPKAVVDTRN